VHTISTMVGTKMKTSPRPYGLAQLRCRHLRRHVHQKSRKPEISMGDAQHKPRLSGMSFGLLISELNSSNLTAAAQAFRTQGNIPDSERATLRKLAKWILGAPAVFVAMATIFAITATQQSEEPSLGDDEGETKRDGGG
jgi:hypothetical protein